ncbi:MAG: hypothetical protein E7052_06840 [Lentisphaerae bacterium]|nr:hypothetical protein [Lentisphaerota bacterium]
MSSATDNGDVFFEAADALRVLFLDYQKSLNDEPEFFRAAHPELLVALDQAFFNAQHVKGIGDCVEALNELVRLTPGRTLLETLEDEFFEMLINRHLDIADYLRSGSMNFEQIEFFRQNFLDVEKGVCALRELASGKRVNPAVRGCLAGRSVLHENPEKLVEVAIMRDPFSASRTFRYINGAFQPCQVRNIAIDQFYGFQAVREHFREHLADFSTQKSNVPLLVSSLPGLGKTQFSINYTLHFPDLTLIFAEPETLSCDLEAFIGAMALRKRRKFVVFFDDIEPDKVDWYNFRTNVGGSAVLPENIMFILASNYQFPINILSRGREITFPVFDEVRCLEMVEDFLAGFGMKNAHENLASVIAAGYIEDFGQKKFTELSPRTLVRYLEKFRNDGALRRKMLDQSRQQLIVRPDAQLFYEFNIKLLRSLYGESYIDDLRAEKLRKLGGN